MPKLLLDANNELNKKDSVYVFILLLHDFPPQAFVNYLSMEDLSKFALVSRGLNLAVKHSEWYQTFQQQRSSQLQIIDRIEFAESAVHATWPLQVVLHTGSSLVTWSILMAFINNSTASTTNVLAGSTLGLIAVVISCINLGLTYLNFMPKDTSVPPFNIAHTIRLSKKPEYSTLYTHYYNLCQWKRMFQIGREDFVKFTKEYIPIALVFSVSGFYIGFATLLDKFFIQECEKIQTDLNLLIANDPTYKTRQMERISNTLSDYADRSNIYNLTTAERFFNQSDSKFTFRSDAKPYEHIDLVDALKVEFKRRNRLFCSLPLSAKMVKSKPSSEDTEIEIPAIL